MLHKYLYPIFTVLSISTSALSASGLENLEKRVKWDLDHIGYPDDWVAHEEGVLEVAIIGAGMAGIAAAHGLFMQGIHQIALFDECPKENEGPWKTYAQMKILRTTKYATGPSLHIPSLTFQAWYEAAFGEEAWEALIKPLPCDFGDYLFWLRSILHLPVANECRLLKILPLENGSFELKFEGHPYSARAKKIVLATGRKGFGGYEIPKSMNGISKSLYSHTSEITDYTVFKNKKIAVLGCGTAAYDAAGASLEAGAKSVDLIFKRSHVPTSDPFAKLAHPGVEAGFHFLSDNVRFQLIHGAIQLGTCPGEEAIQRLLSLPNCRLHPGTEVLKVIQKNETLEIYTHQGKEVFDFIILGTGYCINGLLTTELQDIAPHILLWQDRLLEAAETKEGKFPYLGDHFQFLEKKPGTAPYLKHIYCFNYGALLSHGLNSSSIDGITAGAERLSKGIAADFFSENIESFLLEIESENDLE